MGDELQKSFDHIRVCVYGFDDSCFDCSYLQLLNLILVLVLLIYLLSFVLPLMCCWLVVICGDALLFWLSGPLRLCLHVYMMCLLLYRHVYIGMRALVAYYELVLSYVSQW